MHTARVRIPGREPLSEIAFARRCGFDYWRKGPRSYVGRNRIPQHVQVQRGRVSRSLFHVGKGPDIKATTVAHSVVLLEIMKWGGHPEG